MLLNIATFGRRFDYIWLFDLTLRDFPTLID